jgi:hypothetical protein
MSPERGRERIKTTPTVHDPSERANHVNLYHRLVPPGGGRYREILLRILLEILFRIMYQVFSSMCEGRDSNNFPCLSGHG